MSSQSWYFTRLVMVNKISSRLPHNIPQQLNTICTVDVAAEEVQGFSSKFVPAPKFVLFVEIFIFPYSLFFCAPHFPEYGALVVD